MTVYETQYKSTVTRIAISLLLFEGLFMAQGTVLGVLAVLAESLSGVAFTVVYELISAILYAVTFCAPVLLYRRLSRNVPVQPMRMHCKMPRETIACILFGMAVVAVAAQINAALVSVFNYSSFSEEVLWDTPTTNYELVLMFLSIAVVPAFVEEFLFRGLILSNLLPYGRTTAILASAVLFGIMHQNVEQIFYATAAGVVIGWVYVRTQSIWPCILLHFCNNFKSVLQTALIERLPANTANAVLYAIEGALLLAAVISALYLFLRERHKRDDVRRTGVFLREVEPDVDYIECPVAPARRVRLFFTVPMIIFLAVCLVQVVSLILLALLYSWGLYAI